MTATKQDLEIAAGSDFVITVTVTGVDPKQIVKATYSVIDPESFQVMLQKTEATGVTIVSNQQITIKLVPADTEDLVGLFEHQLRIEDSAGAAGPPIMTGALTLTVGARLAS